MSGRWSVTLVSPNVTDDYLHGEPIKNNPLARKNFYISAIVADFNKSYGTMRHVRSLRDLDLAAATLAALPNNVR